MVPGQGDKVLHGGREAPRMGAVQVETGGGGGGGGGGGDTPEPGGNMLRANSEWGLFLLASFSIRQRAPLIARLDCR